MLFKDRQDAGKKLAGVLKNDPYIKRRLAGSRGVVVSLLRGGIIVGEQIAKILEIAHLPLIVTKIPSPVNSELAIGALSFETVYTEKRIVPSLSLDKITIAKQINIARQKFATYLKRFGIKENLYDNVKNCAVILVDDGIATGATAKTALLYLKGKKPDEMILAAPVAPADFDIRGYYKTFILQKDSAFSSVSQFYAHFPQIRDEEVKRILGR